VRPAKLAALVASVTALVALQCQTSAPGKRAEGGTNRENAPPVERQIGLAASELVSRVERLRDREFEEPPAFAPVDDLAVEGESSNTEPVVNARDRAAVELLFGLESVEIPARPPLHEVARYNSTRHRIEFQRGFPSEKTLEIALVIALVDALEQKHFSRTALPTQLDRRLGNFAARHAASMLVAAGYLVERRDPSVSDPLGTVARRPDVALRLEPLSKQLKWPRQETGTAVQSASGLRRRLQMFAAREGLSLAAALYRAGGWSGVELLHEFEIESTADIVRPDRWMAGRGLGTWTWPNSGETDDASTSPKRIGPALISIWLGQDFPPELARTVYSGWRADTYRGMGGANAGGDAPANHFDWVHQWDTPSSARQISGAFRKLLEKKYGASRSGPHRWRVVRNGLVVGTFVRPEADPFEGDTDDMQLGDTSAQFHPRDPLPLEFVPTRMDTFRRRAGETTVDDAAWTDPAAQLRADISSVQDWTFAESQTLPLRWFAKRDDGTVLQLSAELTDPLGPRFGSDDYRTALEERFSKSLESTEFEGPESLEEPVEDALRFSVSGTKKDATWRIEVWQFRYGDVITTLSLQAPAGAFSQYVDTARTVYSSIELLEPPPGRNRNVDSSDSGSIDYEIESPED